MAEKHVHWWDGDSGNDKNDGPSFVPPSPHQSPLPSSTDDDDSLVDSPSPPTPLTPLASIGEAYRTRDHARGVLPPIQIPANTFVYAHIRTPDDPSLRLAEPSSSPSATSPRKSSAIGLTRRRESASILHLHSFLDYVPSGKVPSLVWDQWGTRPRSSGHTRSTGIKNPTLKEMRIHCISYSLWEPLILRASEIRSPTRRIDGRQSPDGRAPTQATDYISLKHVIYAIYRYLHTPMTVREYDALKDVPTADLQTSVARSFYRRCEAEEQAVLAQERASPQRRINMQSSLSPSSDRSAANLGAGTARSGGLRRLDCLLGQTQFLGLSPVPEKPGEWYIHVAIPPS
ncbi:hypothetical protein A7U60_g6090 [Sanghuangporus baumii]|uniref:DUF6699 domain-containing protein n=1 Tax=Sanghuangporus baumii TaxID=108892 RepID=A0A9Q5HVX8_SANBA|nr:hypothetical protein A7U60_g6090 [Sanghuangporus baumii]